MVRFVKSPGDDSSRTYTRLAQPLEDDLGEIDDMMAAKDSQFARRMYIRAAFAYLEAHIYWLRGIAFGNLIARLSQGESILIQKIALLADETADLDDTENISVKSPRVPTAKWTAFVLRTYAETMEVDPKGLFGENGWNELKKSLRVRDRITHPKELSQLEITDAEIASMRSALTWMYKGLVDIINKTPVSPAPEPASPPPPDDPNPPAQP